MGVSLRQAIEMGDKPTRMMKTIAPGILFQTAIHFGSGKEVFVTRFAEHLGAVEGAVLSHSSYEPTCFRISFRYWVARPRAAQQWAKLGIKALFFAQDRAAPECFRA